MARTRGWWGGAVVVAALPVLAPGAPLHAQEMPPPPAPDASWDAAPPDLGLVGGVMMYDLGEHGEDAVGFGGLRVHFPLSRWVRVEPSVTVARYTAEEVDEGADPEVTLVTTEFQAQLQLPLGRLRPYLGLGAGGVVDLRGERGSDAFLVSTFSAAGGVGVTLGEGWVVRGELRGRGIDETRHSALELGLGLAHTF